MLLSETHRRPHREFRQEQTAEEGREQTVVSVLWSNSDIGRSEPVSASIPPSALMGHLFALQTSAHKTRTFGTCQNPQSGFFWIKSWHTTRLKPTTSEEQNVTFVLHVKGAAGGSSLYLSFSKEKTGRPPSTADTSWKQGNMLLFSHCSHSPQFVAASYWPWPCLIRWNW